MNLIEYLHFLDEKQKDLEKELKTSITNLENYERDFHTLNLEREFPKVFIYND